MRFLGNLGIDLKMLAAQIVNFGLLLWLLAKLVYKPVIRRIEKDERELKKAKEEREKLAQEKNLFLEEKRKEMAAAKKQSEAIIQEAENMAEEIKKESRQKTEKEIKALFSQAKANLRSQKASFEKEVFSEISSKLKKGLQASFRQNVSLSLRKKIQEKVFLSELKQQIESLALKNVQEAGFIEVLEELKSKARDKTAKEGNYEKEAREIFSRKIGPVVLEYAFPLDKKQREEIKEIIVEKIGIAPEIIEKRNEDLLSGFRFEIAGNLVEKNLSQILSETLEYALKQEK